MKPRRQLTTNPTIAGTMLVPLTRGYFAIVDDADAVAVGERNWYAVPADNTVYAGSYVRTSDGKGTSISLHQFLWLRWGQHPAAEIDHRNGDGLDCRRENLRGATRLQNTHNQRMRCTNTSGYTGVYWLKREKAWLAKIVVGGRQRHLGMFDDPKKASEAYQRAAIAIRAEFARTR